MTYRRSTGVKTVWNLAKVHAGSYAGEAIHQNLSIFSFHFISLSSLASDIYILISFTAW